MPRNPETPSQAHRSTEDASAPFHPYSDTKSDQVKLIGQALDRKQMSSNYGTNCYPHFLKTQAPFSLYNKWRDTKQQKADVIQDNIADLAKKRFQSEM